MVRKESEGHLNILTFPVGLHLRIGRTLGSRRGLGELGEVRERFGVPKEKEEGGKRKEMEKRIKVTLGPDRTKDITPSSSGGWKWPKHHPLLRTSLPTRRALSESWTTLF